MGASLQAITTKQTIVKTDIYGKTSTKIVTTTCIRNTGQDFTCVPSQEDVEKFEKNFF